MKFRRILSVFLLSVLMSLLLIPSAAALEPIEVNARAAVLVDTSDSTILYGKNEHQKMYPASITKIMTALLTLEAVERGELRMDQVITASETAFFDMIADGSTAGIKAGEQMLLKDLLYCMMLVSANEACNIVAEAVDGSVSVFVERMNARARELGCQNTHFVNTHGLHDDDHYTTAYDLYLIFKAVVEYDTFVDFVSMKDNTMTYKNSYGQEVHEYMQSTNHYLLNEYPVPEGVVMYGGKTGTTSMANSCLILMTENEEGERFFSVVLGSKTKDTLYHSMSELLEKTLK